VTAVRAAELGYATLLMPDVLDRARGRRRAEGKSVGGREGGHRLDRRRSPTPRQAVAEAIAEVRAKAGTRAGDIEFAMNLFAVGDDIPPHAKQATGADPAELVAADSLVLLRGDTAAMIDELRRRREQIGVSYILVSAESMGQLAPAVEALAGT
jgi:hypothetical protein